MENPYLDLKAIAAGEDPALVECVGGRVLLELNEYALTEGANIQAMKLRLSKPMKAAKENMKDAKKAARKKDYAEAKRLYKAAISDLKELQKEAKDIDDDHLVMIIIETFIKVFIPAMAGTTISLMVGGTPGLIVDFIAYITAYICGISKTFNFAAAVEKGLTPANKAGRNNSHDPSQWWKQGQTRADMMTRLDRLITACEKSIDEIDKEEKKSK